jgi:hypothetical protein
MPDLFQFMLLTLATYRLTRLITTDTIFEPVREKIWSKYPPSTQFGYLFTCNWCTGMWTAMMVTILFFFFPSVTLMVSLVLSISALVGLLASKLDS